MHDPRADLPAPTAGAPATGRVWAVAGVVLTLLAGCAWFLGQFYLRHFPHELTARRGQARLARLLDEVYHVPLAPATEVLAAFAGRADFPSTDLQSEGADWYLARLDPTQAARFEAQLVARNRGFRMLLDHTHVLEVLNARPQFQPADWDAANSFQARARAWCLDPHRNAFAVFYDDRFFLYDSRD